ncbi:Asp-tRNA(Asn)/Glu-tRNA(Gln) amidotransferase subunit GatA [Rubripirellula sp.]|nr:Asp-tRNA(Asn)/Glu-tRNA(Gln) amidotransferase subunit GatA [Rubripirellula sp.]
MLDSATEILRLQATGEASAVEITQQSLDRIIASQKSINAYTYVNEEGAIQAAKIVDNKRKTGQPLGRLAGVPVAVKDILCTTDMPTTCSSKMLQNYIAPYDATVIKKLREEDAIVIGKTNMDEFAMGGSTETSAFGATLNPWNLSATPGGSSGGAAACVASGTVPLSLGSDTGGSIRQPSAFCGVTGLKPTYGRVSRYGLIAFASSLDQVGPIAWSVEDVALLTEIISGFEPKDSTSLDQPLPNLISTLQSTDLRGIKVGILEDALNRDGLDSAIQKAVYDAAKILKDAGAEIVEVQLPHSEHYVPVYYVIAPSEASSNLSRYDGAHYGHRATSLSPEQIQQNGPLAATYCRSRSEGFGAEVKRRIMIGTYALSEGYSDQYYNQALKVRRLIKGDYDTAFAQVDLLLGPTTPTTAFPLGAHADDPLQMYLVDLFTVGANLAGIPAISLPAGLSESGLPIGIQLQAPALQESRLIFAGAAYQAATTHHKLRPENFPF